MTLPFVSGQSIGNNNHRVDDNNISIHVIPIPTTDVTSTTNKKLFLYPPASSVSHMSKWCHLFQLIYLKQINNINHLLLIIR